MDKLNNLIKEAKANTDSLGILIKQFTPLILKASKTYCYDTDLYLDTVAEGTFALIRCIKKYPLDSNIPFPHYAKMAIYSHVKFFVNKEMSKTEKLVSLDEKIKGSENITVEDIISSDETLEEEFFRKFSKLKIIDYIESLNRIEKEVIQRHYFLGHSLKMISDDTGYSYRGIRYAKTRGIQKLKEKLESYK